MSSLVVANVNTDIPSSESIKDYSVASVTNSTYSSSVTNEVYRALQINDVYVEAINTTGSMIDDYPSGITEVFGGFNFKIAADSIDGNNPLDLLSNAVKDVGISVENDSLNLSLTVVNNYNTKSFFVISAFDENNNIIESNISTVVQPAKNSSYIKKYTTEVSQKIDHFGVLRIAADSPTVRLLTANSWKSTGEKITVTSLVENGTTSYRYVGIVATGYDANNKAIETKTISTNVSSGRSESFSVVLDAGSQISRVEVKATGKASNIELLSAGDRLDNGKVIATGSVENGSANYRYVGIVATGYDANNKAIETKTISTNVSSGRSESFSVVLDAGSQISRVEVKATGKASNIELLSAGDRLDNGKVIATGSVENGSVNYRYVGIVATGYDANNKAIETKTISTNVSSGRSESFSVVLDAGSQISRVEVKATGKASNIELLSAGDRLDNGKVIATGSVENGSANYRYVGIVATGYDANNKAIETKTISTNVSSGRSESFSVVLDAGSQISRVEVKATGKATYIKLLSFAYGNINSILSATAVIENGTSTSKSVKATFTGYDINDNPVEVKTTSSTTISSGAAKGFNVVFSSSAQISRVSIKTTPESSGSSDNATFVELDLSNNSTKEASGSNDSYYTFTAPSTSLYRFYTSHLDGSTSDEVAPDIQLYSDRYLQYQLGSNSTGNSEGISKLDHMLTAGSTYYIKISPNDLSTVPLQVTVEEDSDGSMDLAKRVPWEQIYTNELSSKYDIDFYSVEVDEPTEVHLNITNNKVTLLDEEGNIYGIFLPGELESFTLPEAGIYFAKVEYYPNTELLSDSQTAYMDSLSIKSVIAQPVSSYSVSNKQSNVFYGSEGASSRSTGSNSLDGTNTLNYASIKFSYWDPHDNTLIQIFNQFGVLVYEETLGYLAGRYVGANGVPTPSVHTFKWKANLNKNTSLAVPFDTDWDGYPDKNLADNGIYYVVIKPTDEPGSKHPTTVSLTVVNASNYLTKLIPAPPRKMDNGKVITSSNKDKCDSCMNYFVKYVWDRSGANPTPQLTQYDYWSKGIYGLNGLEKFWATTETFIYDPNMSVMDNLQRLIGYGGFIPVLGAGPDGINSILYLVRGQELNASLSAMAMVPFYGDGILGARIFRQIYKYNPCNCFAPGTLVNSEDGAKPIEQIQVGDMVWSKDPNTGEQAYKRVEAVYTRDTNETWNVHIGEEVLTTTDLHPFWIIDKGWVYAKDLIVGDKLEGEDGRAIPITSVVHKSEQMILYNFSVEDYHTYYVSSLNILTHNASCIPAFVYEKQVAGRVKSTLTGSSASEILGKELKQAGLYPDEAVGAISSWQAHHIVPSGVSNLEEAVKARALMKDKFKIDINSAANGVWLPKVKGEVFYSSNDWDDITVQLATHNGRHTNKYFKYVYDKLEDAYAIYGPNGLNYNDIALQAEGVKVLQTIRKELIEGKIALGKVK